MRIFLISTFFILISFGEFFALLNPACGNDTTRISLQEFIQRGIENADKIEFEKKELQLAKLNVEKAKAQRFLPKFQLTTQHGVVPGVESDSVLPGGRKLPEGHYYLDPNLENDWNNWGIYTRAHIEAVQPIFSWGAIDNAVKAARAGAQAARHEFEKQQADLRLRLHDLYYSYILVLEVQRILENARNQIDRIAEKIEQMQKDDEQTVDQSDVYKFKVYRSRFHMRAAEFKRQAQFIRRTWSEVLETKGGQVFEPADRFLDPFPVEIKQIQWYKKHALRARSEIKRIEAAVDAARYGLKAQKSQALPTLFMGLTASFAYTPNRPRQDNPFIINKTNYATAGFGIGIRQSLNWKLIQNNIQQQRVQYQRARSLKQAAKEGILIEINKKYKQASLAKAKMKYTDNALLTSKKWLRQEQLNYDLGMGEVKDLIESLKTKLELEVEMKQRIFEFNDEMAELYHASGIPLSQLQPSQ